MEADLEYVPVKRRKLYEDIVERLERMMLDGRLRPGDQLPSERELMSRFGVGRGAVREALFALNRMGLVNLQNGERAVVTQPTPRILVDELAGAARHLLSSREGSEHFQHARRLFEAMLARDAARHAEPSDIARLEAALERNKEALDDPDRFVETDIAFHYVLAEIPRNPIFTALHSALAEWLKEQRTTSGNEAGAQRAAVRAHQRIFRAVASRDVDAAERAMTEHLDEVARYYWKARRKEH